MADETGSQNDDKDKEKPEGTDTSKQGSEGASGAQGTGEQETDKAPEGVVTIAEFEAMRERMKGADRAKAEAENKLRELEKKDMSALEKAETELKEKDQTISQLQEKVTTMALTNAFLTDNKYVWHDPADALALLDKSDLEIDEETGKVKNLRAAIDKLAKNKKHLLKSENEDDTGSNNGNSSPEASGSATNGKRKGDKDGRKPDYSKRFPALKR